MQPRLITLTFFLAVGFALAAADLRAEESQHDFGGHQADIIGHNGLPTALPGIGTYSGAVSAVKIRGHGTYFVADRGLVHQQAFTPAPKARIIDVSEDKADAACQFQYGVCIIRP